MAGNRELEEIFETADDGIQALRGFREYSEAAHSTADSSVVLSKLPKGSFQMTHEWDRTYQPENLVTVMTGAFSHVVCRMSLITITAFLEAAAEGFIKHLASCKKTTDPGDGYRKQLLWLFNELKGSTAGSAPMVGRLPDTCGDVDNARRLRNACVHNRFRYNSRYACDAIQNGWVRVQSESGWMPNDPIFMSPQRFEHFCRSHLEVLHIALNTLQRKHFDPSYDYNYERRGKAIDWSRILN